MFIRSAACVVALLTSAGVLLAVPVETEIPAADIKPTASSVYSPQQDVTHLVNGAGMTGDTHDNNGGAGTMWHSVENPAASAIAGVQSPAWVRFDFANPETFDEILIWNHNQAGLTDRGFRRTHVLGTSDGSHWVAIAADGKEMVEIPRANGSAQAPASLSVPINKSALKSVVIAADRAEGNYGSVVYGLAAVRFYAAHDVAEADLPLPTALECQAQPFYRHRPDGQPGREITLRIKGAKLFDAAQVALTCGDTQQAFTIPANPRGTDLFQLLLPPGASVTQAAQAKIKLQYGRTQLEQTVTIPPKRQWTVYIYPHAHVDIGYTTSQEFVKRIHERNVDVGIDLGKTTAGYPPGARHVWNTEAQWVVESYLHDFPDRKAAFIDAIKKGWICIDANYDSGDTSAYSDEEFLHFFQNGIAMRRLTGQPVDTMVQFDVPAMSWGAVQAAAQCGIRGILSFPNGSARQGTVSQAWEEKPFWWVAPDGKTRVLFVQPEAYALGYQLKGQFMAHKPFKSPGDQYPESLTGRFPSAVQEFRKDIDRLTTATPSAPFLNPHIFQATERLEKEGSPYDIYTISWSTADNSLVDADLPDAVKDWNETYAYPKLIIAGAHEIVAAYEKKFGNIIPEVKGDYTEYWTDGLGTDARRVGLNRHAKERLVDAETLWTMLHYETPAPIADFNDAWRWVMLGSEHTWGYYDPYAAYAKGVEATKASYFENADKTSRRLLTATLQPIVKPGSNTIAVLNTLSWNRSGLVTLNAENSKASNAITDDQGHPVPSQRLSTGELVFRAVDVPALASRIYHLGAATVVDELQSACNASGNTLENSLVKITLNPQSGDIASLVDKQTGYEFVDAKSRYAVNSYRYLRGGDSSDRASSPTNVTIAVKENGPVVASLLVESKAEGCNKLTREVRIVAGQSAIEMIDTLDKIATRAKEGVHFGFAFNVAGGTTHMDIPWGVMRPEADQIPGSNKNWLVFQRWIDISNDHEGVTWTAIEAPLVELGDLTANIMGGGGNWRKSIPQTQTLLSWALNNHWFTNFPLQQGGIIPFRYVIQPHGRYDSVAANQFGLEQNRPLIAVPVDKNPVTKPLLTIDNPRVAISTLKPSEDDKALILRLRSVSDKPELINLTWPTGTPKSINLCLADEEPATPVGHKIVVEPYGVLTLRVEWP
jgi:alpha-mannosidase